MTLLAELARILRLMDPMPARVLADAQAARAHVPGTPPAAGPAPVPPVGFADEVELLVVLFESVPAVRSAGRRLSLGPRGGEPVLDVEIRHLGPVLRLAGLAPPGAGLEVRHGEGAGDAPVTGAGYFTVDVPAGPVRLVVTDPAGRRRTTGWL